MFENTVVSSRGRRAPLAAGLLIEGIVMGLLVLIPLIHVQALPKALSAVTPIPPLPPRGSPHAARVKPAPRAALREIMSTPPVIPNRIVPLVAQSQALVEAPALGPEGSEGAVPWGAENGVPGRSWTGIGNSPPPPPPPARPAAKPVVARMRVGGQVEAAKLIFQVRPAYPPLARIARVQGTVRLEAVISTKGAMQSLRVLSGPPLLVQAALDAVSQWRYQPTLLNGEPVEVSTEIDVNFTLSPDP
jgi:periplasmic protein TonB